LKFGQQHLQNTIEVLGNFIVPNSNGPISERCQVVIASSIVRIFRVLSPIDFNDQTRLSTDEVDIITAKRCLSGELESAELTVAKMSPESQFRLGRG